MPLGKVPEIVPTESATVYTALGVVRYIFTAAAVSSAASQLRYSPDVVSIDASPVPNTAASTAVRMARASATDSTVQLATANAARMCSVKVLTVWHTFHDVSWMSATIELRSATATVHLPTCWNSTKLDGSQTSETSMLSCRYAASSDPTVSAVLTQSAPPCSSTNNPSADVWHSTAPDTAPPHMATPAFKTRETPSQASYAASGLANAAIWYPM